MISYHGILKHKNAFNRFCEIAQGFCLELYNVYYSLQVNILYYETRTDKFTTISQTKIIVNFVITLFIQQLNKPLQIFLRYKWSDDHGFLLNPNKKCSELNVVSWRYHQIETLFLINLQELCWVMTFYTVEWKNLHFGNCFGFNLQFHSERVIHLLKGFV